MILWLFQPQWFSGNNNYCHLKKKRLIHISAIRLLQQADALCVETAAFQNHSHVQSTAALVLPFLFSQRTTGATLFQNLQCIFRFSPKVFQLNAEKNFSFTKGEGLCMNCLVVGFLLDIKNTLKACEPGHFRSLHLSHPSGGSPVIPSILAHTLPGWKQPCFQGLRSNCVSVYRTVTHTTCTA